MPGVFLFALHQILTRCVPGCSNQVLVAILSRSFERLHIRIKPSHRLGRLFVLSQRPLCHVVLRVRLATRLLSVHVVEAIYDVLVGGHSIEVARRDQHWSAVPMIALVDA